MQKNDNSSIFNSNIIDEKQEMYANSKLQKLKESLPLELQGVIEEIDETISCYTENPVEVCIILGAFILILL